MTIGGISWRLHSWFSDRIFIYGFLRFLGGMNKGKPDAETLRRAEEFAYQIKD